LRQKRGKNAVVAFLDELHRLSAPDFRGSDVIEKNRVKKSLQKVKIFLDKILFCDTLVLVEKCAPTQSGRFAFWAPFVSPQSFQF
jgi:hypothetical protein